MGTNHNSGIPFRFFLGFYSDFSYLGLQPDRPAELLLPGFLLIHSGSEAEMVREVLDVVLDLAKEGRTMVIVTHEMQFAKAVADRVTFLEGGKIVEEGDPKKLFEKPETDRLQRFLQTFTYEKAVK